MSIASDLQTAIARLDVAIAEGTNYARVDLDRLRRELGAIRDQAEAEGARGVRDRQCFAELVSGVDRVLTDTRRLVRRCENAHSLATPTVEA